MKTNDEIIKQSLMEADKICNSYDVAPFGTFAEFRKATFDNCVKINIARDIKGVTDEN